MSSTSKPKYWSEKNSSILTPILERLVRTRGPTGWPMTIGFEIDSLALGSLIKIPACVMPPQLIARKALQELAPGDNATLDNFEKAIDTYLARLAADFQQKHSRCWFILPLKFPYLLHEQPPRRLRVHGVDFSLMQVLDLREYLGSALANCDERTGEVLQNATSPQFLVCVERYGFPIEIAFGEVAPAFDALRGMMELCFSFGRRIIHFGPPVPRGKMPHPRYLVCLREGEQTWTLKFIAPDWEVPAPKQDTAVSQRLLGNVAGLAEMFSDSPKPNSVGELIGDLFRLYAQAMSEARPHNALLAFWQMAESITLDSGDRGGGDKVVARLSWFERWILNQPTGALRHALLAIMHKRNDAVHRGIHGQVDDDDVQVLKVTCEAALNWLIANRKRLPTRAHIAHWWTTFQRNDRDIEAIAEVAKFVSDTRVN